MTACQHCEHDFDPHLVCATTGDPMQGGIVLCQVRGCLCFTTWSVPQLGSHAEDVVIPSFDQVVQMRRDMQTVDGVVQPQLDGVSDEIVEHARKLKNVDLTWKAAWCANQCGDFVFYPPGAQQAAQQQGTPFVIVCGQKCITEIMDKQAG